MMSHVEKLKVNEHNCNYILRDLYKEQENIGKQISNAEAYDLDCTRLYDNYNEITDAIEELCEWRSNHDCDLIAPDVA